MLRLNQLIGFGVAQAVLTSITQALSATSTASTITAPSGIQAGDLIVLLDKAANSFLTAPTAVTPTGFTNASNVTSAITRQMLSWKKADGTEGGTSITGMNGSANNTKIIYVFRGNIAATTVTPSTVNGQATSAAPTNQNVAASGGTAPLVIVAGYGCASGTIIARGFSPAKDGEIEQASTGDLWLAYKIYNSSPADVTISMGDFGTNFLQSMYIQMS